MNPCRAPQPPHAPPGPRRRRLWAWLLTVPCAMGLAQPAPPSAGAPGGSALPLRNLLVEVRQVRTGEQQDRSVQGRVELQAGPAPGAGGPALSGRAELALAERSGTDERALVQQVRVLNGRPARLSVGVSRPWRVVQQVRTSAGWFWVPTTVFIERNSGMWVLPRWNGGDDVELDVRAALASGGNPFTATTAQAGADAVVVVRLGEWTLMAESEDTQRAGSSTLMGQGRSQQSQSWRVEVRVTAP